MVGTIPTHGRIKCKVHAPAALENFFEVVSSRRYISAILYSFSIKKKILEVLQNVYLPLISMWSFTTTKGTPSDKPNSFSEEISKMTLFWLG